MLKNLWFKVWDFVQAVKNGHYVGFVVKNFRGLYLTKGFEFAEPKLSRAHVFSWRQWSEVSRTAGNSVEFETVRRKIFDSDTTVLGGPFGRDLFEVRSTPPGGPFGPSPEKRNVTFFNIGDGVWLFFDHIWVREVIAGIVRRDSKGNLFAELRFEGTYKTVRHDSPRVWPLEA